MEINKWINHKNLIRSLTTERIKSNKFAGVFCLDIAFNNKKYIKTYKKFLEYI